METLARWLVILGVILIVLGGVVYLAYRINLPIGRLPGDIRIQNGNFTCFFPLATTLVLSVILTVLLNIIVRLINR